MQKQVWSDEQGYWFLNILAVHPDSQGKGIGAALVRHVTKMVTTPSFVTISLYFAVTGR